jgi:hypothetical protein
VMIALAAPWATRTLLRIRRDISYVGVLSAVTPFLPCQNLGVRHFLDKDLTMADRRARLLAKLRLSDSNRSARLAENAKRLDHMRDVLESLEKTNASATRALGFPMIRSGVESKRDRRS